jgi:hypothetical protein
MKVRIWEDLGWLGDCEKGHSTMFQTQKVDDSLVLN